MVLFSDTVTFQDMTLNIDLHAEPFCNFSVEWLTDSTKKKKKVVNWANMKVTFKVITTKLHNKSIFLAVVV